MANITELRLALQRGLSVVTEVWHYRTRDWVTSVYAEDIDNNGDIEVLVGSRDGRVYALTSEGERQWERIVGSKKWIGAVVGVVPEEGKENSASILVGTQDGKVYALDRVGQTINKNRQISYAYDSNGWAIEREQDIQASWHSSEYEIRYLSLDSKKSSQVVIDSEDRRVYTLNYSTGETGWTFPIEGVVCAVYCCDIDGDGRVETLVGSSDQHLYVLDDRGALIERYDVQDAIHAIYAADIDHDNTMEILLGTDGKVLTHYAPKGQKTWRYGFPNRLLTIAVADVNGDGENEILVGSEDKHLYILDAHGKELWRQYLGYRMYSLYARDIDNDGRIEILIGAQDNKIHCCRILLSEHLNQDIDTIWDELGRPSRSSLEGMLTAEQLHLLQDLVTEVRSTSQAVTMEQIEKLIAAKKYAQALQQALLLKQHRVQVLWTHGQIGAIQSLALGDISRGARQEIIAGTDRRKIYAFTAAGHELWSLAMNGQILSTQIAYVDTDRWARILVATSSNAYNCVHVISGVRKDHNGHIHAGGELRRTQIFDGHITGMCVRTTGGKKGTLNIIVCVEEKKVYVYGRTFEQMVETLDTEQGVKGVASAVADNDCTPTIVVGGIGDIDPTVYAYNRKGKLLWSYAMKGRAEAIYIKDIDADDQLEVIVGSQDRNIHVLDRDGELKWRYFLPDVVTSLEACDLDGDGRIEVLAGCSDEHLYVFSREGDLLWTHQTFGGILAMRAEDIDNDGNVEIIVGTESQLEVVRVVNQRQLQLFIDDCWNMLQQQKHRDALIREFLDSHSHYHLRAFALREMAGQKRRSEDDFKIFETLVRDGSLEVRRALMYTTAAYYKSYPQQAQAIFSQLLMSKEQENKLALVKHIAQLMKQGTTSSWDDGFGYLQRLARNNDRFVRRAVMRELYTLVEDFYRKPGRKRAIFGLLLVGLLEPEVPTIKASDWVRQEAARTLAHFLDLQHGELIMYLNALVAKGVKPEILDRVAYHAKTPFIKNIFQDLGKFLADLDDTNVLERLKTVVGVLKETKGLRYGEDTLVVYRELYHLMTLYTLEDIAHYQCNLKENPKTSNVHYNAVVTVLSHLYLITRALRSYLRRDGLKERVNSLLEANRHIEGARKIAKEQYSKKSLGEPLSKLPDNAVVTMILKRWQTLVTNELYHLSGRAELVVDIQTKEGRFEEQVVIWLVLQNKGRVTAENVHVELLESDEFTALGKSTFETEAISAQDEIVIEFTIEPHIQKPYLAFEILYTDIEEIEKREYYEEQLKLRLFTEQEEFLTIPNPYTTGVPSVSMCYGREEDLEFLRDNLIRSAATLLVLYGQRRTGKTTLLFQLVNTPLLAPHIPILIDMQNESYGINAAKFFYRVALYISQALAKNGVVLPCGDESDFEKEPTFTLGRYLDAVERELQERKLIILIDEFEVLQAQVEKQALAPEVFEYLRSVVQNRPDITLLLSGVHTIQELTSEYWSTFFNIADHYRLSKLSEQGAIHLITSPVRDYLTYEPYAIKKIRQLTDDQPFLIHLICRPLIDYCNEREKTYVTLHDVNVNLDEVIEKGRHHFQWIWDQCSQDERYVLAILAEMGGGEGRFLPLIDIEEQYENYVIPYTRDGILTALYSLIERDIVTKVSDEAYEGAASVERYQISVGLVRSWLYKTKSVRQVLREKGVQQ